MSVYTCDGQSYETGFEATDCTPPNLFIITEKIVLMYARLQIQKQHVDEGIMTALSVVKVRHLLVTSPVGDRNYWINLIQIRKALRLIDETLAHPHTVLSRQFSQNVQKELNSKILSTKYYEEYSKMQYQAIKNTLQRVSLRTSYVYEPNRTITAVAQNIRREIAWM